MFRIVLLCRHEIIVTPWDNSASNNVLFLIVCITVLLYKINYNLLHST